MPEKCCCCFDHKLDGCDYTQYTRMFPVTRKNLNAEWRMTDSCSGEKSLRELEFNDLNIHLYLSLNYGTASEHLKYSAWKLYGALWCFMMFLWLSWGLKTTQNSIRRTSDLDRSRLIDTRSTENDRIGADTDPEYRIGASLLVWIPFFELRSFGSNQHRIFESS